MKKSGLFLITGFLVLFAIQSIPVGNNLFVGNSDEFNHNPKNADIDYANMTIYDLDGNVVDQVLRVTESINITYDSSGDPLVIDSIIANITFSDDQQYNVTLSEVETDLWAGIFTPGVNNATGEATVGLIALDGSEVVVNNPVATESITIENNLPNLALQLNSTEIYRTDFLDIGYYPSDIENSVSELSWKLSLHNQSGNTVTTIQAETSSVFSSEFQIPKTYTLAEMYLNATCWDVDGDENSKIYTIDILNNEPEIVAVEFEIDEESILPAELISTGISRVNQNFTLKVNASDIESNSSLTMSLSLIDSITRVNVISTASFVDIAPLDEDDGYFEKTFVIPSTITPGISNFYYNITDGDDLVFSSLQKILITNNNPEIAALLINGESNNQLQFYSGDQIKFSVNASDIDSEVEFFQINLLYSVDGEDFELNYTIIYENINTTLIIRAADLPTADYIVFAIVYDDDGAQIDSDRMSFSILAEKDNSIMTWILILIALVIGLSLGFGIYYWKDKKSYSGSSYEDSSKKPAQNRNNPRKTSKKSSSETKSDTNPKPEEIKNDENDDEKSSKSSKKKMIRRL